MTQAHMITSYWSSRTGDAENGPLRYAELSKKRVLRSRFLTTKMKEHFDSSSRILEIGCNSGRNLGFLRDAGFSRLHGFDVNENAIDVLKEMHPDIVENVWVSSLVDAELEEYDVIFTMAVLEHVPYEQDDVVLGVLQRGRYVFTIEDEVTKSERHFPRNYRRFLKRAGFEQFDSYRWIPGLPKSFVGRLFKRAEAVI